MTDLTKQTPREIDERLAELHGILATNESRRNSVLRSIRRSRGMSAERGRRYAQNLIDCGRKISATLVLIRPLDDEYRRRPWSRFFLVTNGNGHVHSSMSCSTCYPTTTYAWLPELSGKSESEAVEEWGERMCTTCFPSAPVDPNYRCPARVDREARAERERKSRERQAKRDARAISNPDGSPLRIEGYSGVVKTERTARIELVNALAVSTPGHMYHGGVHHHNATLDVPRLVEAIAAKTGESESEIIAAARKKAIAKVRKELRDGARQLDENRWRLDDEALAKAKSDHAADVAAFEGFLLRIGG